MAARQTAETPITVDRGVARVITLPRPEPGFIGEGHTAVHAIDVREFAQNDPFIMLADDRVDLPRGRRAGGPHPHAGFEIATFVVDGDLRDRDEGLLSAGDVAWTTAGSGVVHGEDVEPLGKVRILQLWMTPPSVSRWVDPAFERLAREHVPVRREPGVEARVYSGTSGSIREAVHTYLPLTMVDIRLAPNAVFDQELPASYNGFLYPLEGDLLVGGSREQRLAVGQIGWLERVDDAPSTTVRLATGDRGARVVLYAGERQGVPIVTHGPFVGETRADLVRVSQAYAQGRMPRLSESRAGRLQAADTTQEPVYAFVRDLNRGFHLMNTRRHIRLALMLVLLAPLSARAQGAAAGWSGVYVGAHAGVAWHDLFYVEPDDPGAALSPEIRGFAGGLLAGYARPLNHIVIGMEVDTGTARGNFASDSRGGNEYTAFDLGWNSHLRGRVAYPRGRVAPFFAAGLAALRIKVDDTDTDFGEATATHIGWTVGGGIDAALTSRVAVRAEFLHDDYGRKSHDILAPQGRFFPAYGVEVDGKANVLRAAVLYRF